MLKKKNAKDKRRDWEREKQETKRDTRSRKGNITKGPEINKISLWLFGPLVFYFPTPSISPPSLSLSYIVLGLCFCLPSWKVNFFHQPQDETTFGSIRLSLLPFLSIPPSLSLPPSLRLYISVIFFYIWYIDPVSKLIIVKMS